jgi:protein SCO1/2
MTWFVLLLAILFAPLTAHAYSPADFAFIQKPGSQVPMDLQFTDQAGRTDSLIRFMAGKPAILALGYFHCPNLCGVVRDDLLHALSHSGLRTPHDYTLLVVSIDPAETPADAASAEKRDLARYAVPGASQGWHYLAGSADNIRRLEGSVGFRAQYDPALKQFLHPTGLVFLSPTGSVSGYVLGVGYQAGDVRAAVQRAASGQAAAALPVLLLCFHFDPATGRYTLAILKLLQLGGALTILCVGAMLFLAHRKGQP